MSSSLIGRTFGERAGRQCAGFENQFPKGITCSTHVLSAFALVAQRIEYGPPKAVMVVRFHSRAQKLLKYIYLGGVG